MLTKKELRVINVPSKDITLRETGDGALPTISGYTAVYNEETRIGNFFREVIRPGFFTRALEERQDVRALFNHDSNNILGRTESGTLRMREDSRGLFIEVDPPDTQAGRDTVTSIRRGDVDGMSFAFTVRKSAWEETDEDGALDIRELLEIEQLFDVGPVVYPAYDQTTANVERGFRSGEEIYKEEHTVAFGDQLRTTGVNTPFPFPKMEIPDSVTISVPTVFRIDLPKLGKMLSREEQVKKKQRARERELELLELG